MLWILVVWNFHSENKYRKDDIELHNSREKLATTDVGRGKRSLKGCEKFELSINDTGTNDEVSYAMNDEVYDQPCGK